MALPTVAQMEAYIRQKAAEMGIDPDIAVAVAKGEGLAPNTWQSNMEQPYGREASYGPFQLHVDPTGKRPGMGNDFMAETGLNPANPDTWDEGIDYALKRAREGGWAPWMGAKAKGITGMMGIGQDAEPAQPIFPSRPTDTVAQPGAGAIPDGLLGTDISPSQQDAASFTDGLDTIGIAKMGLKVLDKAKKKSAAEDMPLPEPLVLQPLQRYTLKGLLG